MLIDGINPLPIPYTNVVMDNQTIFVRVQSNLSADCYNTTSLELIVNDLPVPITPTPYEVCDDDNDGFSMFDLTTKDAEILGAQTGMTVTYHETLIEAIDGVNPQASPYSNISAGSQTW